MDRTIDYESIDEGSIPSGSINQLNKKNMDLRKILKVYAAEKSALAFLKIHLIISKEYDGVSTLEEYSALGLSKSFYTIIPNIFTGKMVVDVSLSILPITFHTKEQAKEFIKHTENIQLLKDYYMI